MNILEKLEKSGHILGKNELLSTIKDTQTKHLESTGLVLIFTTNYHLRTSDMF